MVATKVQLVPANKKKVSRGKNKKLKVCIHDTANTSRGADAQAHANLQLNNPRRASWQWQVDDKVAIQSYRHNDRCWHSGTTKGNAESIAIEICINSDGDYAKAVANAAELTAKILKNEGLKISDVVTHYEYDEKECPRQLRASRDGISWNDFLNMVRKELGESPKDLPSTSGSSSSSSSPTKSVSQLAQEVIDGKHGSGDARKRALGSQYAAVQAEVNRRLGASSSSSSGSSKSTAQLAQEVIDGRHGSGDARKRALGSRYNAVQAEVNRRLGGGGSGSASAPSKSNSQLAREVIDGRHGSGEARKRALGSRYNAVQAEVNRILGGRSSGGGKSISQLATEVIEGRHGSGDARKRALGSQYNAVQAEVNRRLR